MKRVQGNPNVALIECTNPVRNRWRVRWDIQPDDDGNASFMEEEFNHRPSGEEIKSLISGWISDNTREKIISGFRYEGVPVWLSQENQSNYERSYLQATLCQGALPVTFKFGTDEEPVYRTFENATDLGAFYRAFSDYISQTQEEGWAAKDNIDLGLYGVD